MKIAAQNAIASASLHAAASENTILGVHDAPLGVEIKAAGRKNERRSNDQSVAHRVLRDRLLLDELQEIVRPSGLHARPRETVAAERLAGDHGPGDTAVDVEVADG